MHFSTGKTTHFWKIWKPLSLRKGFVKQEKKLIVEVHVPRLGALLAALAAGAYLALASTVWLVKASRPHNEITALDVFLLPLRWEQYQYRGGLSYINAGLEAADQLIAEATASAAHDAPLPEDFSERYQKAGELLSAGLAKAPDHALARLRLAELRLMGGQRVLATNLLLQGLDYGYPDTEGYITTLLQLAYSLQDYASLQQASQRLLGMEEILQNQEQRYRLQRVLLRCQLREADYLGMLRTAQDILEDPQAPFKPYDIMVLALIHMENYEEALLAIEETPEGYNDHSRMLLLKAMAYWKTAQLPEMRDTIDELFRRFPAVGNDHLEALVILADAQQEAAVQKHLRNYLVRSLPSPDTITQLASIFADMPDSRLVAKVSEFCQVSLPQLEPQMAFLMAQAYITEGNWIEARKMLNQAKETLPESSNIEANQQMMGFFELVLDTIENGGEGARHQFVEQIQSPKRLPEMYWEASEAMRKVNALETAFAIVNDGLKHYPYNNGLSDLRTRIRAQMDNHQPASLPQRRPDYIPDSLDLGLE